MSSDATQAKAFQKACILCGKEYSGDFNNCPDDGTTLTGINRPLLSGIIADKYEILGTIAGGGAGTVYQAKHTMLKKLVAIKTLHPHLVANAAALKRFQQEAFAGSQLDHPHVSIVTDFGLTTEGVPYIVMEYVNGVSLAQLLQKEHFLEQLRSIKIFSQVASALAHAHHHNIIHRDLKPGNIMLIEHDGRPDYVKIVDFGIAKLLVQGDGETGQLTQTGDIFGSPLYMSPEQCTGAEIDRRADIYSLGCVMFRTITGQPPFMATSVADCIYKHVNEDPPPFSSICPERGVAPEVEAMVVKCLSKKPDDRFQNMEELKLATDEWIAAQTLGQKVVDGISTLSAATITTLLNVNQSATDLMAVQSSTVLPALQTSLATTTQTAPTEVTGPTPEPALSSPQEQVSTGSSSTLIPAASSTAVGASSSAPAEGTPVASSPGTAPGAAPPVPPSGSSPLPLTTQARSGVYAGVDIRSFKGTVIIVVSAVAAMLIFLIPAGMQLKRSAQEMNDQSNYQARLRTGLDLYNAGKFDEAYSEFIKASKSWKTASHSGSNTAELYAGISLMYSYRFKEARDLLKSYLASTNDEKSVEAGRALIGLGVASTYLGDADEAQGYISRAFAITERLSGKDKLDYARNLYAAGFLALRKNKLPEAEKQLQEALTINKQYDGSAVDTARILNELGQAHELRGDYAAARRVYQDALTLRQRSLNPHSPAIANSLMCLASLDYKENKLPDAQKKFQQALEIDRASLGADNLAVAEVQFCLGVLYTRQHQFGQAQQSLQQALDTRKQLLGASDPAVKHTSDLLEQVRKRLRK